MKSKGRQAFILVEIIVGLALIGLLASVTFPSITVTKLGVSRAEKKSIVIDQAQRIVMTLKPPNDENNTLLNALTIGDVIDYEDNLLTDNLIASIYIDASSEHYQVYSVEVKFSKEDISAKFQATRNME